MFRFFFLQFITSYLVDHVQGALKDGIKDLGYLAGDVSPQLVDNGRHGAEDFGFTSSGDVALVVNEDGVQQWRNKVFPDLKDARTDQNTEKRIRSVQHFKNIYITITERLRCDRDKTQVFKDPGVRN